MPWQDNSGNRGGPTRGPWGQPPRGGDGGGNRPPRNGGRGEPPDLEELLQASRQRLKRVFPKGSDGGGPRAPELNARTLGLGAIALVGFWLASGVYTVDADELAVVTTFGRFEKVTSPGLNWHIPGPIQNARVEKVRSVRETYVPERSQRTDNADSLMLTGDKNIVDIAFQVQWVVKPNLLPEGDERLPGVAQFMFNVDNPENLVLTVGESAIREVVGRNGLDFVQTEGRTKVQEDTLTLIQAALDLAGSGIEVRSVNLLKADPPTTEVNEAFLDVEAADQDRERAINTARAYANRIVPEARGEAQRIIEDARAYSARVTADARGQADRFNAIREEYAKAPAVTRQRMYLETVERVLGPMNKVIIDDRTTGGVVPYLPLTEIQRKGN